MISRFFRKHYNRMIDISFWTTAIIFIKVGLYHLGLLPSFLHTEWVLIPQIIAGIGSWALAVVLILWERVRDEYSEQIWNKTAKNLVAVLLLAPVIGSTIDAVFDLNNWFALHAPATLDFALDQPANASAGYYEVRGMVTLFNALVLFSPFLFLTIYRWRRWRDA